MKRSWKLPLVLGGVLLASVAVMSTASASSPGGGTPGSADGGDPLFPGLGNGGYDAIHYDIGVDYNATTKIAAMTTSITAKSTQALSRFNLDFDGNTITRLTVNGAVAGYTRAADELVITPSRVIADASSFQVDVTYTADPREKHNCPVIFPLTGSAWGPTADGFVLAGQPNCMHTAFPSNDITADKATYSFTVATPEALQSATNGILTSITHTGGKVIRKFTERDPIASELVQIAVGKFNVYNHAGPHGLPLRDVIPPSIFAAAKPHLDNETKHINWMEAQLDAPYPFDTYGSLGADTGFSFELESQTLTLYTTSFLGQPGLSMESIMVHELSHHWFGDSVSPKSWNDLWLNEGHATWYQDLYAQQLGNGTLADAMHKQYADGDRDRASDGPVAAPNPRGALFYSQRYGGGALVLFALHEKVGDAAFRKIEHQWVTTYRNTSPDTQNFIDLASATAHQDLSAFLTDWLYGTTTPPMPKHPDWTVDPVRH